MTDIVKISKLAEKIKNLHDLHLGIINKTIIITDKAVGCRSLEICNDKRFNDLIWELYKEALLEMRNICPDLNELSPDLNKR